MNLEHEFFGPNYGYILELYDRYQRDPDSVDESTRRLFSQWTPPAVQQPAIESGIDLRQLIGAVNLAHAIRSQGYLVAKLDPLSASPATYPTLTLDFHDLNQGDLSQLPADVVKLRGDHQAENASQAIEKLRSIYCGAIGYEYGHIRNPEERNWLQQVAETRRFHPQKQTLDATRLLDRLSQVEAFEVFLNRIYPAKTRFSIEGLDMLVPMLDELISEADRENIRAVMIGMAHRGRLNVLAHILQKPYEQILAAFILRQGPRRKEDRAPWRG